MLCPERLAPSPALRSSGRGDALLPRFRPDDPGVDRCRRHDLLAILTFALCGVICGADFFVEIERFGHAKRAWLKPLVPLPHGIPSHDSIGRVFAALDPKTFETAFLGGVQALIVTQEGA